MWKTQGKATEFPLRKAPEEGLRISHLEIVGMTGLVGIPEKNRMGIVFCEEMSLNVGLIQK